MRKFAQRLRWSHHFGYAIFSGVAGFDTLAPAKFICNVQTSKHFLRRLFEWYPWLITRLLHRWKPAGQFHIAISMRAHSNRTQLHVWFRPHQPLEYFGNSRLNRHLHRHRSHCFHAGCLGCHLLLWHVVSLHCVCCRRWVASRSSLHIIWALSICFLNCNSKIVRSTALPNAVHANDAGQHILPIAVPMPVRPYISQTSAQLFHPSHCPRAFTQWLGRANHFSNDVKIPNIVEIMSRFFPQYIWSRLPNLFAMDSIDRTHACWIGIRRHRGLDVQHCALQPCVQSNLLQLHAETSHMYLPCVSSNPMISSFKCDKNTHPSC